MASSFLDDYSSAFNDLGTFPAKETINLLTMLAGDYQELAGDICSLIKTKIYEAPPAMKISILYVVDSILKNIRGDYLQLFADGMENTIEAAYAAVRFCLSCVRVWPYLTHATARKCSQTPCPSLPPLYFHA